jgi:hypothetical protein
MTPRLSAGHAQDFTGPFDNAAPRVGQGDGQLQDFLPYCRLLELACEAS